MGNRLEYLEVQITDNCNLNCKGCSHCAGLMPMDSHVPVAVFSRDMRRLRELIPCIAKLRILGGEPLLNPELTEYLRIARECYPDSDIRVVTNGLLCLRTGEELYEALRRWDVSLDISMYPPTERIRDRLESLFERQGIRWEFTAEIRQFAKRVNLNADSEPETTFWNCNSRACNFLRAGTLSLCPVPVILEWLAEKYGFAVDTASGKLDLHDPALTGEFIVDFVNQPNAVCRYCTDMEFFDWVGNAPQKLEDWIVKGLPR